MYGKIHNMDYDMKYYRRSSVCMTMDMATATVDGKDYEILLAIGGGILVRSKQSKNEFILDFQSIMNLAIDEGLDKDPKEIYTKERIKFDKEEFEKKDEIKEEQEKKRKKK